MWSSEFGKGAPLLAGAAVLIAIAGGIAMLMPDMFGTVVALWVAVSIPVGIAVGHCTLNRED